MRFIIPSSDKMRSLFQDVTSSGYSALGACRGPALSSQPLLRGRKVHRQSDEAAERRFICVPGRTEDSLPVCACGSIREGCPEVEGGDLSHLSPPSVLV